MEKGNNLPLIAICGFAVTTVLMIIAGISICKLPVVAVCVMALLETAIAMCLHNLPLWLHGSVLLAELVVGILCQNVIFIVFLAIVYVAALLALKYIEAER